MTEPLVVKKRLEIRADAVAVWNALTDPRKTRHYLFGAEVVSTWRVGGPIRFARIVDGRRVDFAKGTVLRVELGRLLQFTLADLLAAGAGAASAESVVTYELVPRARGTELTVTQGDFAGAAEGRQRHDETEAMWDQALPALKRLLES